MRISRFPRCLFVILGSLALLSAGCSGKGGKAEVTGKVTLDGKPLGYGSIRFVNPGTGKEKGDANADIEDGEFSAKKVPVGEIKVTVDTESLRARLADIPQLRQTLKTQEENDKKMAAMMQAKGLKSDIDDSAKKESVDKMKADLAKLELIQKKISATAVPKKYQDEKTTPITVTIKSGSNTLDTIELSSK